MPLGSFVSSKWTSNLSERLRELVNYEWELENELMLQRQRAEGSIGMQTDIREARKHNIRERVSHYSLLLFSDPRFSSVYRSQVLPGLRAVMKVLLEHPVIADAAHDSGGQWMIGLDLFASRGEHQMDFMLSGLIDHAVEHSPEETASALAEVLRRGKDRDLRSYAMLLFHGLHVERKHDFDRGLSIVSFEEAQRYLSDTMLRSLLRGGTDVDRGPIGAVVYEMKWGPAFVPSRHVTEAEWSSRPEAFREEALLLVDLLAVTHELPVVSSGRHTIAVERQIDHLMGRERYVARWMREIADSETPQLTPTTTPSVLEEQLLLCGRLFSNILGGKVQPRLAVSRLASSTSRIGALGPVDRIIDVAIALEIMYGLNDDDKPTRGKGSQLSRLARDLIGENRFDRKWIDNTAESLFSARNAVGHGSLPRNADQAYRAGLKLARRTLIHKWGDSPLGLTVR